MRPLRIALISILSIVWTFEPVLAYAKAVHIQEGVPAPFTGLLLPAEDMAELVAKIHLLQRELAEAQKWAQDEKQRAIANERSVCKIKTDLLHGEMSTLRKMPHAGMPWWVPVVIGIGALGLGVGVGIYLDRR